MATTISGGVRLNLSLNAKITAAGNNLTDYSVPVQPDLQINYTAGSADLQANKIATLGGSLAATTLDTDLTTVACVDGSTGFSHVRELIIYNDATNNTFTLSCCNTAVSNSFSPFLTGTNAAVTAQPSGVFRMPPKPIGATGHVVDSSHKVVRIDSGANTVPYRIVIVGD